MDELLDNRRVINAEDQQRFIHWIGKRTAQNQVASVFCLACKLKVLFPVRSSLCNIVIDYIVNKQVIAHAPFFQPFAISETTADIFCGVP
jgi:hypothetical protein